MALILNRFEKCLDLNVPYEKVSGVDPRIFQICSVLVPQNEFEVLKWLDWFQRILGKKAKTSLDLEGRMESGTKKVRFFPLTIYPILHSISGNTPIYLPWGSGKYIGVLPS